MTTRRDVLKAAAAAAMVAPTPPALAALKSDAAMFDLYEAWRAASTQVAPAIAALARAEQAARAQGVSWDRCPAVAGALAEQDRIFAEISAAMLRIAGRASSSVTGVAVKLALWRREKYDSRDGEDPSVCDLLPFSAYCDLVNLTGLTELSLPRDEDALRAMAAR